MDRLLWISMSGAKENFHSIAVRSNNLANANTHGFKADFENTRAMPVFANAYPSRAFAMDERPGYNMDPGMIETTGRALDVAIRGDSMFAVTDQQGREAYTRLGSFQLDQEGRLRTSTGLPVLDEDGTEILLPLNLQDIAINDNGIISGRPAGGDRNALENFQRIKMVTPVIRNMEKGYDGLFRARDGRDLATDVNARLDSGVLEASNVNPVEELTNLIRAQRQYDTQVKMMKTASEMDQRQTQLMAYE
ncbi:MAG: flagellar basal body rod protein FlgF [Succinivibrionaceae bacterium]|nr:flagellar basal body rod protein FlgF [Succinivibrionaceae bacterium]